MIVVRGFKVRGHAPRLTGQLSSTIIPLLRKKKNKKKICKEKTRKLGKNARKQVKSREISSQFKKKN
jgi:hypothetical protein